MKRVEDSQRRVFKKFADELDAIKIERIKNGVDKKMISDPRLTRGIYLDPNWKLIKERLSKVPRDEELK